MARGVAKKRREIGERAGAEHIGGERVHLLDSLGANGGSDPCLANHGAQEGGFARVRFDEGDAGGGARDTRFMRGFHFSMSVA